MGNSLFPDCGTKSEA